MTEPIKFQSQTLQRPGTPVGFPIMQENDRHTRTTIPSYTIPWHIIQPHEARAILNHDQTLERLAQRGGLAAIEAVCVLENKRLPSHVMSTYDPKVWHAKLAEIVKERLSSRTT